MVCETINLVSSGNRVVVFSFKAVFLRIRRIGFASMAMCLRFFLFVCILTIGGSFSTVRRDENATGGKTTLGSRGLSSSSRLESAGTYYCRGVSQNRTFSEDLICLEAEEESEEQDLIHRHGVDWSSAFGRSSEKEKHLTASSFLPLPSRRIILRI